MKVRIRFSNKAMSHTATNLVFAIFAITYIFACLYIGAKS